MPNHFTEGDIRSKAYELWEQAGCPDGEAEIYWERAQAILSSGDDAPLPSSDGKADLDGQSTDKG